MKRMLNEVMKYKIFLFLLVVFIIGNVISTLALPALLSSMINQAIPQKNIASIINNGGRMFIYVFIGFICNIGISFFSALVSTEVGSALRKSVFSKIQYFAPTEIDKFSVSSLITRTTNDVIQVQTFVNLLLRISLMAPFMCVGGIIMAFNKSTSMSMIVFISIPIMVIFVFVIGKISTPVSILMQNTFDTINLVVREKITGIRVARAFGTEKYEEERFRDINNAYMNSAIYMNKIVNLLIPGLSLILYFTMVALLAFGGYIAVKDINGILIGDIIAVIQYVMQIMMSVMMLSIVFMLYPRASVSIERIFEVLEMDLSITEKNS